MKLIADYHTHTYYSHGAGSVQENVAAARSRGLEVVGISDHGPGNLFGIGVSKASDFLQIKADIFVAQRRSPNIRILLGAEANVISTAGDIDIPPEILEHLDYLLVGLHPLVKPKTLRDAWRIDLANWAGKLVPKWDLHNRYYNTKALINAVQRYPVLAVTHPGYRINIDTKELAGACAKTGTAMEINCSHDHITPEYINIARVVGAKFMIGSDAHRPEDVGRLDKGLQLAAVAGLRADNIINAAAKESAREGSRGGIKHHIAEIRRQKKRRRVR